jgi:peroxiredoxin
MIQRSMLAERISIGLCLALTAMVASRATAAENLTGKPVADFRLSDSAGAEHALADLEKSPLVVVVFLGTECPLARMYAPRLNELASQYADRGVKFLGIDSNLQDSPQEIATFVKEHDVKFPVLKDPANKVADQLGASRTPEAFVLDGKRVVRYHGRIDDQYVVGLKKPQPGRRDLAVAIDELLAGGDVSQPEQPAVGCFIGRVREAGDSEVTYSKQIARIFQKRCVECHRPGEIGPFALTSYEEAVGWGETIREVVDQGRMPPWFADPSHGKFINDARLPDEEKKQISQWVDAGCPEGDPKDLPEPPKFLDGWNIPQPHLVLQMADKPFQVPADGVVDYKHFEMDPGFTEDKWLVASEARPGNRAVVHHILVFLKPPGEEFELLRGSLLAAYAPGSPPHLAPKGVAKKVPAGSKIIMQVHYTPNGKPQEDMSSFGLVFCDRKDVVQEIESGWAVNFVFAIPPKKSDYKVNSLYRFTDDRMLMSMTPHMHVRGKSFRYEAEFPDGKREVLLNVPRWDFNWQLDYILAEPRLMPKGTVLRCEAHFDNSLENPSNPDPTKTVRFGEQTWEEMMIGWFTAATVPGQLDKPAQAKTSRKD